MPSTAPSEAPDDAPRMSGETRGLRNRPWKAVPATASAAPTRPAASTRGPRTCQITVSTAGATFDGWPVSFANKDREEIADPDREPADGEGKQQPGDKDESRDQQAGCAGAGHRVTHSSAARQHAVDVGV